MKTIVNLRMPFFFVCGGGKGREGQQQGEGGSKQCPEPLGRCLVGGLSNSAWAQRYPHTGKKRSCWLHRYVDLERDRVLELLGLLKTLLALQVL
jgi:hypothetical protein